MTYGQSGVSAEDALAHPPVETLERSPIQRRIESDDERHRRQVPVVKHIHAPAAGEMEEQLRDVHQASSTLPAHRSPITQGFTQECQDRRAEDVFGRRGMGGQREHGRLRQGQFDLGPP